MWRRLNKEEFATVNEEVHRWPSLEPGDRLWPVCSAYELRSGSIWAKYFPWAEGLKEWTGYDPLVDTPDLFLRFARLYDQGFSQELVLQWVHRYGLLGQVSGQVSGFAGGLETVEGFWEEVSWAAGILAMYEVALSGDNAEAKRLVNTAFPFLELARDTPTKEARARDIFGESLTRELVEASRQRGLQGIKDFTLKERTLTARFMTSVVHEWYEADYLNYALVFCLWAVNSRMKERLVFQGSSLADIDGPSTPANVRPTPANVRPIWRFDNLLAALYLQMHWLLSSGGELARCENCGRIISLARPHPEGRKHRRDKRFCDDACRQAHHRSKSKSQTQ